MELIKILQSLYAQTRLNTSFQLHFAAREIVILDLIMPIMDGRNTAWKRFSGLSNTDAKVIIASGYSEIGPANGAITGGAKGYVMKPFNMRQLLTTVREILDEDMPGPVKLPPANPGA